MFDTICISRITFGPKFSIYSDRHTKTETYKDTHRTPKVIFCCRSTFPAKHNFSHEHYDTLAHETHHSRTSFSDPQMQLRQRNFANFNGMWTGAKVRWVKQDGRGLIPLFCSVSVYYFPTEEDDEDGPTLSDKALEAFRRCIDIFCVWDCCWPWLKFQEGIAWLVFDPFTELFITLCIVVNTLFMALDHHDMDKDMESWLKKGNYVSVEIVCAGVAPRTGSFGYFGFEKHVV